MNRSGIFIRLLFNKGTKMTFFKGIFILLYFYMHLTAFAFFQVCGLYLIKYLIFNRKKAQLMPG